jgi:hypothetical protein
MGAPWNARAAAAWPIAARAQQPGRMRRIGVLDLTDLQWSQVELASGRLHVRRAAG